MNKLDAIMDFSKQSLPPIFKRQGKDCYLDPIRDKLIYITPEETVRQRVLAYLINELHVPKDMILVEEHLSHYNIDSKRRVDIVINAQLNETELVALAVIELCHRKRRRQTARSCFRHNCWRCSKNTEKR